MTNAIVHILAQVFLWASAFIPFKNVPRSGTILKAAQQFSKVVVPFSTLTSNGSSGWSIASPVPDVVSLELQPF